MAWYLVKHRGTLPYFTKNHLQKFVSQWERV